MTSKHPIEGMEASITARLPVDLVERMDALIPALARMPAIRVAGGRASRSTILRMALERALPLLESEMGEAADVR